MATWNLNGLAPNKDDVEALIKLHKLDAILISETHCTNSSNVQIKGYNTFLTNHPDGRGHAGTAIIICDTIKHHLLTEYRTEPIQATTVVIEDDCGFFNLTAVYCPPKHKISQNIFSDFFKTLGDRFIAGGNWNSKHTC